MTLRKGFTLIELLIVIAIIGILVALILPNLNGVRERARDSRRKIDLNTIQQALRLYYNDNQAFPLTGNLSALTSPTLYIPVVPVDPSTSALYDYASSGTTYTLKVSLENEADSDIASSQARCSGAGYETDEYVVCEQ